MTLWQPDPALIRRPAYLSLADQFARAIHDGRLANGARLPTHRRLADDLKLSVQTVSRAYEELIRRGLISGEVGRGSFVQTQRREPEPPYLPERLGEVIDLSILKPVCEPMHLEKMKQALSWLAENLPSSSALSFRPNMVFPRHRAVAVDWLRLCGLEASPQNISLTNGATAGMTVALMSVAPPGSTVATEAIGHHTLVPLARYLGFNLKALGQHRIAFDEPAREDSVSREYVGEAPPEQPRQQAGEQPVADHMTAPIGLGRFMLASADDHVELLFDQHPHHFRRSLGVVGKVAVGHYINIGINVGEHPPDYIALALLPFRPDDRAGGASDFDRPVAAVVVVDVDGRVRQRGAEAGDRFGDRCFLIVTWQDHGDAQAVQTKIPPLSGRL